jgi:hypothetical protein
MSRPVMMSACLLILLLALPGLAGCRSASTVEYSASVVPEDFSLSIYRRLTDGRHTYLTLSPEGELSYGPGRAALSRVATPVLTLSPAQRQQVWALIVNHHLLQTPDQGYKTAHQVAYEVTIDTSKSLSPVSFHVVDESVPPALARLQDKLFKWQANVSYKAYLPATEP